MSARSTDLTILEDQSEFTSRQLSVLGLERNHPAEAALFFHQVKRTGLDPFAKQIYMITRQGRATIQTGIDGFRLIARRVVDARGESLGYSPTLWCDRDGQWRDVWLEDYPPAAAKVTILRNGQPFDAVARLTEYQAFTGKGELTTPWRKMPGLMIAKCAEALALRKAFPQDLSGIYTEDEMGQATNGEVVASVPAPAVRPAAVAPAVSASTPAVPVAKPATKPATNSGADLDGTGRDREGLLAGVCDVLGWSVGQAVAMVEWFSSTQGTGTKVSAVGDMTEEVFDGFATYLESRVDEHIASQAKTAGSTEYGADNSLFEDAEVVEP